MKMYGTEQNSSPLNAVIDAPILKKQALQHAWKKQFFIAGKAAIISKLINNLPCGNA